MSQSLTVLLAVFAGVIIAAILHDAFEVMLLPRRVKSRLRIVRYFFEATWAFWRSIGLRLPANRAQEFLALFGPLSLVVLLLVWAAGLIFSFGALFWAINTDSTPSNFPEQIYFSGVTFFTLGYGDLVPHGPWARTLSVLEAGTGLGFIAMVIGYLPVLYQLFSRRETHVMMLDSIAGSPPSAVTLLCRCAEGHSLTTIDTLFAQWQLWAAELLESHLSYPMLAYYRSQHDNESWLAALTAVLDATVLVMLGFEGVPTFQARLTFATSRLALIEMGRVLNVGPRPIDEDRLPPTEFEAMQSEFAGRQLTLVDPEAAEQRLAAFRNTYEPFLNGLAHHLLLPLPAWTPDADQLDNWVKNPRGKTAKRLLEQVPAEPESPNSE